MRTKFSCCKHLKPNDKPKRKKYAVKILEKIEENVTFLTAFALTIKQLFMYLQSSTNIMSEFGEVKIHTFSGKLSVIARRWCGLLWCGLLLQHFSFMKRQ